MKKKITILSVFAIGLILASCKKPADGATGATGPTGPQGPSGPVLAGNLKGFISHFDLDGAKITTGLAGDSVSIDNGGQVSVTDATGLFSFTGLSTGVYNLTVKRSGYGEVKIQSVQFTGGGDTYRNANISKVPAVNMTSLTAYDTTINSVNVIRLKGVVPAETYAQSYIIYVGIAGNNTVNSSSANQAGFYVINIASNATTFKKDVPTADLYDLGYASGNTAYFAAYSIGGNTNASSYADLTNNKTIFTALGPTAVLANAPVQ